jgi:TATA-box binding protein (TBP) (component of TFIID and TFIIIB)
LRIMGRAAAAASPLSTPFPFEITSVMTFSASSQLREPIHLRDFSVYFSKIVQYEPELFPAVRLVCFNPVCVNLFSTAKVTMLGLRSRQAAHDIMLQLNHMYDMYRSKYKKSHTI